jgi:hypothetical protein
MSRVTTQEILSEVRQSITHSCRLPTVNPKKKISNIGPKVPYIFSMHLLVLVLQLQLSYFCLSLLDVKRSVCMPAACQWE